MTERRKYRTVSIPTGITDDVVKLIEELHYWPSVSSFVREATLDKLKLERRSLQELREAENRNAEEILNKGGKPSSRAK